MYLPRFNEFSIQQFHYIMRFLKKKASKSERITQLVPPVVLCYNWYFFESMNKCTCNKLIADYISESWTVFKIQTAHIGSGHSFFVHPRKFHEDDIRPWIELPAINSEDAKTKFSCNKSERICQVFGKTMVYPKWGKWGKPSLFPNMCFYC